MLRSIINLFLILLTSCRKQSTRKHLFSQHVHLKDLEKNHSTLKEKLESKGYMIADEFNCKGRNTNSFSRFFGGLNRGRPNAGDLKNAEEFAQKLKQKLQKNGRVK